MGSKEDALDNMFEFSLSPLYLSPSVPRTESSKFNRAPNPRESVKHDKVATKITAGAKRFGMVYSRKLSDIPDLIAIQESILDHPVNNIRKKSSETKTQNDNRDLLIALRKEPKSV